MLIIVCLCMHYHLINPLPIFLIFKKGWLIKPSP